MMQEYSRHHRPLFPDGRAFQWVWVVEMLETTLHSLDMFIKRLLLRSRMAIRLR